MTALLLAIVAGLLALTASGAVGLVTVAQRRGGAHVQRRASLGARRPGRDGDPSLVCVTRLGREPPHPGADAHVSFGSGCWLVVEAEAVVGLAGAEVIGGPLNARVFTIAWTRLVVLIAAGSRWRGSSPPRGVSAPAVIAFLSGVLPGVALLALGYGGPDRIRQSS